MIENDLIPITSALMKHRDKEVREQAALLISSFASHERSCPYMKEYTFKYLKDILEDEDQSVRNAASWVFQKLSVTASGRELIRDTQSAETMISSFINHSSQDGLSPEKGTYLIQLLEAFVNITFNDYGIVPLLGKSAIS